MKSMNYEVTQEQRTNIYLYLFMVFSQDPNPIFNMSHCHLSYVS